MTPEEIVGATIAAIQVHDIKAAAAYTADSLTVNDPNLPHAVGKQAFFAQMTTMLQAFPDWRYDIHNIATQGDRVSVELTALATHTAPLQLAGATLPPTGRRVQVPDLFIFTVKNDLIVSLDVDSPPHGGAPEMMRQLGLG